MKWFDTYHSNTLAGGGNQLYFLTGDDAIHTGRIYYKVYAGGKYNYSLLFSNIMDSTYSDGSISHCNLLCDEWEIVRASIGVSKECSAEKAGSVESTHDLIFSGSCSKKVMPGEFFVSDAIELNAEKGEYICIEIVYKGRMIPYHEESILPLFVLEGNEWVPCRRLPITGMLGCDRKVQTKIGFIGDSITQGIGTAINSYAHWNALAADAIGEQNSYWNLGIGFGRGADAASDGAWLFKAKQMDAVVVCFGTNDIGQGRSEEQIKADLLTIVRKLQEAGAKVLIQTLPPFNWEGEKLTKWLRVNDYVRNTLSEIADGFFDVVPILIDGEEADGKSKYGGHPDENGCKAWAEALVPVLREFV